TTAVGTAISETHGRASNRPMARAASTTWAQSWRNTCSTPGRAAHHVTKHSGNDPATTRVRRWAPDARVTSALADAAWPRNRSRNDDEKSKLVAHSTRPATSSGWRRAVISAIGPPIE